VQCSSAGACDYEIWGVAVAPCVTAPNAMAFVESVTAGLVEGGAAPVPLS
jgi:hypothetical protein